MTIAHIHKRFEEKLRGRLNGQASSLSAGADVAFSPAHARQAEVSDEVILAAAADALGLPFCENLNDRPVSHDFLSAVPIAFARRHGLIGLVGANGCISLAISDVSKLSQAQVVSRLLVRKVEPLLVPRDEILRVINAAYQTSTGQAQKVIEDLDRSGNPMDLVKKAGEDLLDVASKAPVIKLVNLLLFEAVKCRASDVHVQPYESELVIRFRVDGLLHDVYKPPKSLQEEIVSRIKIMGGMNIAERRLAQDGRSTVEVGDRIVDLRIATLPTSFGERAVIRLLDKSARLYRLPELGMPENVMEVFGRLIRMDHGIILVTGPTGSGKSTTLYAVLQEINCRESNILTLEDPIEYRLEGISQTQVSEKKGMTFVSGLRHVLRQDPDIIMIGEIRDAETAHMAIQSALTGHLVFSTLHTNDAAGAVARMLDLGVEPYLLASSLLGVLAQRLVRRICPECRQRYVPTEAECRLWGVPAAEVPAEGFFKGTGCNACMGTGFRERVGIFEMLTVNELIREQVLHRARASTIKGLAISNGMTTLRASGMTKAAEGITTMEEVARVSGLDEF